MTRCQKKGKRNENRKRPPTEKTPSTPTPFNALQPTPFFRPLRSRRLPLSSPETGLLLLLEVDLVVATLIDDLGLVVFGLVFDSRSIAGVTEASTARPRRSSLAAALGLIDDLGLIVFELVFDSRSIAGVTEASTARPRRSSLAAAVVVHLGNNLNIGLGTLSPVAKPGTTGSPRLHVLGTGSMVVAVVAVPVVVTRERVIAPGKMLLVVVVVVSVAVSAVLCLDPVASISKRVPISAGAGRTPRVEHLGEGLPSTVGGADRFLWGRSGGGMEDMLGKLVGETSLGANLAGGVADAENLHLQNTALVATLPQNPVLGFGRVLVRIVLAGSRTRVLAFGELHGDDHHAAIAVDVAESRRAGDLELVGRGVTREAQGQVLRTNVMLIGV
jgi:hypothetical protein